MPCRLVGWLVNEETISPVPGLWRGSKQERHSHQVCPPERTERYEEGFMFIIGIDPHKASHTATVIDGGESVVAELRIDANASQRQTLIDWAAQYAPRSWAVEGAAGMGALLAQQLVAVGEVVLDVPP